MQAANTQKELFVKKIIIALLILTTLSTFGVTTRAQETRAIIESKKLQRQAKRYLSSVEESGLSKKCWYLNQAQSSLGNAFRVEHLPNRMKKSLLVTQFEISCALKDLAN